MNSKNFLCINKDGTRSWYRVRQIIGLDKIFQIGDRIPGIGHVIDID